VRCEYLSISIYRNTNVFLIGSLIRNRKKYIFFCNFFEKLNKERKIIKMKKTECFTDEEVKKLAEEIVEKYQELFSGIDLSKIHFIRIKNKKNRNIIELKNISFPYNLDINYAFYFLTYNKKWMMLNEEQKKIAVMNGLYGI